MTVLLAAILLAQEPPQVETVAIPGTKLKFDAKAAGLRFSR